MLKPRRARVGARGARKSRDGCRTCKIRHKKCDETKPACVQCTSTQRICDFTLPPEEQQKSKSPIREEQTATRRLLPLPRCTSTPRLYKKPSNSPSGLISATGLDSEKWEFFRIVCTSEFAVFCEVPEWDALLTRYAHTEPCIYHAALAISTMARNSYCPDTQRHDRAAMRVYVAKKYNLAIRLLNERLGHGHRSRELIKLAILSAAVFINLECYMRSDDSTDYECILSFHLFGAMSLLQSYIFQFGEVHDPEIGYIETLLRCLWAQCNLREFYTQRRERQISGDRNDPELHSQKDTNLPFAERTLRHLTRREGVSRY
ncbi:hypothetical protein GGR57DRAFT_374475 [Xylariaceae sp. FL1272]|nr:hypothetical protein GGR57DRAFT_374475 [Xylariaceae sp. FL1272]